MIPDAEKIVGGYLRSHPAIVDLGARVVGKPPSSTATPWIRLTQIDDRAVGDHRSDHLIEFLLQLDCYAGAEGGQPEASLLNRTARAALVAMPDADGLEAVVTGVRVGGALRLPDTDVDEPARERYVRTITVWAHS